MPDKRLTTSGSDGSGQDEPPMARLVIEEPRLSDEALYKCDVTYVKGKCPSISLVRVQMMALPGKAQISLVPSGAATTNQLDDGQLIGPFNEHEQLQLVCRVFGGRPQPRSIIWRKMDPSGRRINLQHEQSRPKSTRNASGDQLVEVYLNHTLTSADLGAKFECHVEHEALDGSPIHTPAGNRQPEQFDSMLDLHPSKPIETQPDDEDQSGSGTNHPKTSLDTHVFLDLNVGVASLDLFMSRVNKRNSSEPLKEGDLVELECIAYNSKPPANISWFNGAEPIEQLIDLQANDQTKQSQVAARSQRHRRLLQRNQVTRNNDGLTYNTHSFLSIKLSRHEHRAQISCQAHQDADSGGPILRPVSKTLELQVQHAPIVLMEPAGGISVNELRHLKDGADANADDETHRRRTGSENNVIVQPAVSVYCIYSANPSELVPNSTRWFKDGQQLQTRDASNTHLSESLTATGYPVLNINQVSRRDAGRYDCQVANSVGTSERLPQSEAVRLEVNFRPSVRLRLFEPTPSTMFHQAPFRMDQLTEIDPGKELILVARTYVLVCDVLEARPNKIEKFHWFRRSLGQEQAHQLIGVSEASQFVLSSLAANFSPASYVCGATNALGPSDNSNQLELRLSYSPGPSFVRPVLDAALRRQVLQSGEADSRAFVDHSTGMEPHPPLVGGQKILLECATKDPGQPRANSWLWFKNNQPIELSSANNNPSSSNKSNHNVGDLILDDNPISGLDLSSMVQSRTNGIAERHNQHISGKNGVGHENEDRSIGVREELQSAEKMKLLGSGRYLFIPSIQLAHKGNYSCVALNRFGSGPQSSSNGSERDSYNLMVALAPSFIQPLQARTYWPEVSSSTARPSSPEGQTVVELVCHVQCDPMCNIEWLRNGHPIDLRGKRPESQEGDGGPNYVSHQIRQSILDENLEADLFKSIESRLILRIQGEPERTVVFGREKVLARRAYLNGSNYTCQSTPNTMGPAIRSTSKFVVQYPPENVLINGPSDKLSLVEGSNGPRLSCEASGEPQVQYRWLLSKSSGSDLASSKYGNPMGGSSLSGSGTIVETAGQDRAINQMTSSVVGWTKAGPSDPIQGANDLQTSLMASEGNLIELVGSTNEPGSSTLDLSQLSLDRKQSGHYICEASNKLGQSRQSVYVNVLYKPTCSGLHLHSLDMLMAPPDANDAKSAASRLKPWGASANDEYVLVRENSDDFINLRKTLLVSPLLDGHLSKDTDLYGAQSRKLSLQGSIFQSILDDRKYISNPNGNGHDKDALINTDDSDTGGERDGFRSHTDRNRPNQSNSVSETASKTNDAWSRFNALLLNFLNTYVRQVKNHQDSLIESPGKDSSRDKRQNPRGSPRSTDTPDRLSRNDHATNNIPLYESGSETGATKNLLTFACMAQDGNPMGNLSFDWSFGAVDLPETISDAIDLDSRQASGLDEDTKYGSTTAPKAGQLIYVNPNRTVSVILVRRLDTHSALSPFQVSLLTLEVVIDERTQFGVPEVPEESKIFKRNVEAAYSQVNERYAPHAKAPVIRSRPYGANNNHPRVNQNHDQQQSSNIQFANEFETRPAISPGYRVDLDEHNWQERLGSLLNCRVSNHIGTSDVCHVRVNLAERLKSLSSSESQFARWRMPSLAQKSLLIVSILVGCALIVFLGSALLIGPYLRGASYKSSEIVHESGENNTRQSTSSQKSSVLGLLTNGDSSLQGSSDEDSNSRSNHTDDNGPHTDSLQPLDLSGSSLSGIVSRCGYQVTSGHNHYQPGQVMRGAESLMANYDKPRRLQATYKNGAFSEQTPDRASINASHYLDSLTLSHDNDGQLGSSTNAKGPSDHLTRGKPSAGSRLLASLRLKSLSRFKVDKISDQAGLASHLADLKSYHARSISSSGTNTTGMTNLCLDADLSLTSARPNTSGSVSKYFGSPAFRHSYTNARTANHSISGNATHRRITQTDPPQSSRHDLRLEQRYADSQAISSMVPTYSNLNNHETYNAMDEFIRRKELESSLGIRASEFARSESMSYRNRHNNSLVPPSNSHDLSNLYSPQMVRQQPYHFSGQPQSMTLQRANRIGDQRPPIAARPPRRIINDMQQYQMPANNRYSMPTSTPMPMVSSGLTSNNTIDNHLETFASTLAAGHYTDLGRFRPPLNPNDVRQLALNMFGNSNEQSTEHIYDVNAYATPEQTPQRGQNNNIIGNNAQDVVAPRSRVGQLIQTFNSSLPE